MKNKLLIASLSLLSTLFAASIAIAGTNATKEINTAITHAGYAEKMTDVNKVHLHLHHVINCLVGPHGFDFDAAAGDPCKGMGNGAINDYKADKLNREMLNSALENAEFGLMTNRLNIAQNAASLARGDLKKSEENM